MVQWYSAGRVRRSVRVRVRFERLSVVFCRMKLVFFEWNRIFEMWNCEKTNVQIVVEAFNPVQPARSKTVLVDWIGNVKDISSSLLFNILSWIEDIWSRTHRRFNRPIRNQNKSEIQLKNSQQFQFKCLTVHPYPTYAYVANSAGHSPSTVHHTKNTKMHTQKPRTHLPPLKNPPLRHSLSIIPSFILHDPITKISKLWAKSQATTNGGWFPLSPSSTSLAILLTIQTYSLTPTDFFTDTTKTKKHETNTINFKVFKISKAEAF